MADSESPSLVVVDALKTQISLLLSINMKKASRFATTILLFVLLAHVATNVESSSPANGIRFGDHPDGQRPDDGAHRTSAWRNIDLIELTPSLEQQLYQAKRLNNADPGSMIELAKLTGDAYRYELDRSGQRDATLSNRPTTGGRLSRQVMNGLHLLTNSRRLGNSDSYESIPISNNNGNELQQLRFSRGSSKATFGRSGPAAADAQLASEQDGDSYGAILGDGGGDGDRGAPSSTAPASIGNQEDASRKSLWTSDLLRDLLIAQETRNR